jgi:hypothetical protein
LVASAYDINPVADVTIHDLRHTRPVGAGAGEKKSASMVRKYLTRFFVRNADFLAGPTHPFRDGLRRPQSAAEARVRGFHGGPAALIGNRGKVLSGGKKWL